MEQVGDLRRPVIPQAAEHNGHIYYVLMPNEKQRRIALASLNKRGIKATFHYSPLHTAAAGRRFGKIFGSLVNTEQIASRLIRLPLFADITMDEQARVVEALTNV